jgi:steroid Delta-isomerase
MPDRDKIVEIIETYCRSQHLKDKKTWLGLFSPEIVHEDPVGAGVRHGLAKLEEFFDGNQDRDINLKVTDTLIVCGNEAMAIMKVSLGPKDQRIEISPIIDHFTFNDAGKIIALRAFLNY